MKELILYLVVPAYNEEEAIEHSAAQLRDKMLRLMKSGQISAKSKVLFVNDGSSDGTLRLLTELCRRDPLFLLVNFLANAGHQNAIMAGMSCASEYADAVVTIDADLQQDIEKLDEFIQLHLCGNDVVYGVRNDRDTDGTMKRLTASLFYSLMKLLGCNTIRDSADYRLMSKKAVQALMEYSESNLFLRGLIPHIGFSSTIVYFDVKKREHGTSKYTLKKMLKLAVDGITSFSIAPIHWVMGIGLFITLMSFVMILFSLVSHLGGGVVPGYTTTVISTWLIGGLTMFSLGVIGEYVGKTYMETKHRPRYHIDSCILNTEALDLDGDILDETGRE